MRVRGPARLRCTAAVVCAAVVAAGCAGSTAPRRQATPTTTTASSGASAPSTPASSPHPATTTTSPPAPAAVNLPAPPGLRAELFAAYTAAKRLPADDFIGPLPGTLYYAYVPSTGTYWATATFTLSSTAPTDAAVQMQDGGNTGVFSRHGGETWHAEMGQIPFPCPDQIPPPVAAVWHMTYPAGCQSASS